jgi:hypothetical protein
MCFIGVTVCDIYLGHLVKRKRIYSFKTESLPRKYNDPALETFRDESLKMSTTCRIELNIEERNIHPCFFK